MSPLRADNPLLARKPANNGLTAQSRRAIYRSSGKSKFYFVLSYHVFRAIMLL
jgi:hypothetical protein